LDAKSNSDKNQGIFALPTGQRAEKQQASIDDTVAAELNSVERQPSLQLVCFFYVSSFL
jgi:hypothetical protein